MDKEVAQEHSRVASAGWRWVGRGAGRGRGHWAGVMPLRGGDTLEVNGVGRRARRNFLLGHTQSASRGHLGKGWLDGQL